MPGAKLFDERGLSRSGRARNADPERAIGEALRLDKGQEFGGFDHVFWVRRLHECNGPGEGLSFAAHEAAVYALSGRAEAGL